MNIHPTSVISEQAEIGRDVVIGPFCHIQGRVKIGDGSRLESHVVVGSEFGDVTIGRNNHLFSGCVVGGPPQDLKYKGECTKLIMGDNNYIRECATLNIGTPGGGGETRVGNNCLIMSYVHIAHDCHLGDHVVIANSTQFAGHVTVEDHVRIGGVCAFNQFIRIGQYAYIAGASTANKDILPFTISQGNYAVMRATNKIGLERAGFAREDIENIHRAVRLVVKGSDTIEEALRLIEAECRPSPTLNQFVAFMKKSERGLAL
jgi:UDP-N-acetylglucosamine acyltransferase